MRFRHLAFTLAAALLTGCAAQSGMLPRMREIADFEVIQIVGIDNADEGDVEFTAVVTRSSPGNAEEPGRGDAVIVSVTAPTVFEAVSGMNVYTERHKHYGYIDFILIGEDAAANDISRHLDYIIREHESRWSACVFVVRGGTAKDFLRDASGTERDVAETLRNMRQEVSAPSNMRMLRLIELFGTLDDPNFAAAVPALTLASPENIKPVGGELPDKTFVPAGYAIIQDSRLAGYIGKDIARGYNFLAREAYGAPFTVTDSGGRYVSLEAREPRVRLEPRWSGDTLTGARFVVEAEANITERHGRGEYSGADLGVLARQCEDILRAEMTEVVALSQSSGGDFLGVGTRVRMRDPVRWERIEDDWASLYPGLPIEVDVKFRIRGTYDIE